MEVVIQQSARLSWSFYPTWYSTKVHWNVIALFKKYNNIIVILHNTVTITKYVGCYSVCAYFISLLSVGQSLENRDC